MINLTILAVYQFQNFTLSGFEVSNLIFYNNYTPSGLRTLLINNPEGMAGL
jgi:hypothetical protein